MRPINAKNKSTLQIGDDKTFNAIAAIKITQHSVKFWVVNAGVLSTVTQ
jgi:hypothetical protein